MIVIENTYGHTFDTEDENKIPVCSACGFNAVKAHLIGDDNWKSTPVKCPDYKGEQFEEQTEGEPVKPSTSKGESIEFSKEHFVLEGLTSIIIPVYIHNYSLMHYLGNTIGSIREHTDYTTTPYELIIVDNDSPLKDLKPSDYLATKVILNSTNEGYAKAVNRGIRAAEGEYIAIVNSDVQVYDHWLDDMLDAVNIGGLDLVMATPMYGEPLARAVEANKKRSKVILSADNEVFSDFRDFSCVLMKRSLLDEIGLFDEQFFMYGEDLDFLRRMDQASKKYASTKLVNTHHIIGATSTSLSTTPEIMNESKQKLKDKWGE